jgi:hypothetical protein
VTGAGKGDSRRCRVGGLSGPPHGSEPLITLTTIPRWGVRQETVRPKCTQTAATVRQVTLGGRPPRSYGRLTSLTVRYACPICGGGHPPEDHGLADGAGFRALDGDGLRRLRAEALEELLHGVLADAERDHLVRVAQLVRKVDARLERLDV